jgi:hypothetical protein
MRDLASFFPRFCFRCVYRARLSRIVSREHDIRKLAEVELKTA